MSIFEVYVGFVYAYVYVTSNIEVTRDFYITIRISDDFFLFNLFYSLFSFFFLFFCRLLLRDLVRFTFRF